MSEGFAPTPYLGRVMSGDSFLGTAFAVTRTHLITCAHVARLVDHEGRIVLLTGEDFPVVRTGTPADLDSTISTDLAILEIGGSTSCSPVALLEKCTLDQYSRFKALRFWSAGFSQSDKGRSRTICQVNVAHETFREDILNDVQLIGGFPHGMSGSPILCSKGDEVLCFGVLYLGSEGAASSRFISSFHVVSFATQWLSPS